MKHTENKKNSIKIGNTQATKIFCMSDFNKVADKKGRLVCYIEDVYKYGKGIEYSSFGNSETSNIAEHSDLENLLTKVMPQVIQDEIDNCERLASVVQSQCGDKYGLAFVPNN